MWISHTRGFFFFSWSIVVPKDVIHDSMYIHCHARKEINFIRNKLLQNIIQIPWTYIEKKEELLHFNFSVSIQRLKKEYYKFTQKHILHRKKKRICPELQKQKVSWSGVYVKCSILVLLCFFTSFCFSQLFMINIEPWKVNVQYLYTGKHPKSQYYIQSTRKRLGACYLERFSILFF